MCLRIGSFQPRPRERRELATWLSHADGMRLLQASLTADDVGFAIVYGASANTRRWWPPDERVGFVPQDDAEAFADELDRATTTATRAARSRRVTPAAGPRERRHAAGALRRPRRARASGIEEELFLLDGETLDLLPNAREVLERVPDDPRFKLELPASQLEIVTPPCPDVATRGRRAAHRPARSRGCRSAARAADDRGRASLRGRARAR